MYLDFVINDINCFDKFLVISKTCPTLMAQKNGLKVVSMEQIELKILGEMDNSDGTLESSNRVYDKEGLCPTLPTCCGGGHQPKFIDNQKIRIRKLTPKECWRLMNFSDSDFEKAEKVVSNSQLYKQAGNSIVTSCLVALFSQLNIKGCKSWNERTDEEKRKLLEVS